jgi:Protein of unknown function (DUF3147)
MAVKELIFRFFIGGTVVSIFALLSDLFQPKRFAGLFGAAPSVALATLTLTVLAHGKAYASEEARSMAVGAIAFFVYAYAVCQTLFRLKCTPLAATTMLLCAWLGVSFGLWAILLR